MGIGNKTQAFLNGLSAMFIALGTASATVPEFAPQELKYTLAGLFWMFGVVGFALKEALGSAYTEPESKE